MVSKLCTNAKLEIILKHGFYTFGVSSIMQGVSDTLCLRRVKAFQYKAMLSELPQGFTLRLG